MNKIILMALLCISFMANAITLDDVQRSFASQPVVRAKFQQDRQISGMAQPLHSSGEVLIAKSKGLWWQQQHPFPMTLVLDDSHMVQVMGSQAPQIITADSNPQMFQFNHLLRALFQADRKVLDENFSSAFTDQGNGKWQLVLTPTTTPLDKLFSTITLEGDKYLNRIALNDLQGDFTEITFSDHRLNPRKLTHEEQQRFAF
ncbi:MULTISPECIES: outer membrane lipoprotein carrier protein LolA [Buttiauxella]|nr:MULTISPECIES: outer membrane lipoprotein carrier protein LolA [Buttiauxella]MCE0799760.1 outer membrane lipoprotein carrier protein LolA [Buttiauxella sp. W03-F01]MCE0812743.1 outer membrane lipoprotein carrier protein LolA [Buttiauxella sp. S04-F03]MCE0846878.1 outer membrane lipoprotein carrier protein LolA [Buttiauxella sp. A2-C1_F]TDX18651.1 outer membrane lipoprotein-sorting protein [Buttiauxella sp. BIGb0552]